MGMPPNRRLAGDKTRQDSAIAIWSVPKSYKSVCTFIETNHGSWKIGKNTVKDIGFPTSVDKIATKHWAVTIMPRSGKRSSGLAIKGKALTLPLGKALRLGDKNMFRTEAELLDQLKKTAKSINLSEAAASLRESLQLKA